MLRLEQGRRGLDRRGVQSLSRKYSPQEIARARELIELLHTINLREKVVDLNAKEELPLHRAAEHKPAASRTVH